MSQSFDISTSYDALNDTVYDIFDMDAYCSSLSPSVPSTESVLDTPTPARVLSITPRCAATPVRLPPLYHPPLSPQHPLSPQPPLSPLPPLLDPIREKVVSAQPLPHPPPVLWTPPHPPFPPPLPLSCTKHVWYSEHGMYCRFEIILEQAMSVTHIAVILRTRTSPAYEEEFTKMDYPDARNGYGTS